MKEHDQVSQLARQILDDAILLRRLSDRVYELMREEVRNQRDRLGEWRR